MGHGPDCVTGRRGGNEQRRVRRCAGKVAFPSPGVTVGQVPSDRSLFTVRAPFAPSGDQPAAIRGVLERFGRGDTAVTLAGATGTGKSASTAWVIEALNLPTLVLAPNKVLAAQLASELRELLPDAYVGFFVSHFAYYRPEAYVPSSDTFIEKDSAVDSEIERLRHEVTVNLLTRRDVVVVASVSAIYGLGRPEEYRRRLLRVSVGEQRDRDEVVRHLVGMEYTRNDVVLERGRIRVRGDVLDVVPASGEDAYRIEFFGDVIESLAVVDPVSGMVRERPSSLVVPPASHHVFDPALKEAVLADVRAELTGRLAELEGAGRLLEAQRLRQRTEEDIESIETVGFCRGIENYSRHFDRRAAGQRPSCLLDFFSEDFLLVVDESHVTVPQIAAMYEGDRSRKSTLVEYGFRLPSALDNRPLKADEFWSMVPRALLLSATPGPWEAEVCESGFVDQVIRPTGLIDPAVTVLPQENRLEDLLSRIRDHDGRGNRTLVTTLTKRQAEQLTEFLAAQGLRVRYLHSDVDTVSRIATLRDLRRGALQVVVGVNLLREGLDLPEVGLVAVLDADAQGFLRSATSLVQTIGRAARNPEGEVLLYADVITPAMRAAIDETDRRRRIQIAHNEANGIVPTRLVKTLRDVIGDASGGVADEEVPVASSAPDTVSDIRSRLDVALVEMRECAGRLAFEEAAVWREEASALRRLLLELEDLGVSEPAL
ncbi:MAG: excinuclease ABC subunit UvrB [Acidobacteria bacterium]|nr:excinuclease ABC subunit UvrB [Acidobacteriota bacterium]